MIDIFVQLYEKLNDNRLLDIKTRNFIKDAVDSNGLDELDNIPCWFQDFWQSILDRKSVKKQDFITHEILNTDEIDIINFMAEIADIIDMNYKNYGEGITMDFIPLNITAFICLEGGLEICFYEIKNIND